MAESALSQVRLICLYHAFGGVQRENICFVDGDEAYDWYYSVFQSLLEESSDEITTKALQCADAGENIDELPIAGTIKANKVFVIEPTETKLRMMRQKSNLFWMYIIWRIN